MINFRHCIYLYKYSIWIYFIDPIFYNTSIVPNFKIKEFNNNENYNTNYQFLYDITNSNQSFIVILFNNNRSAINAYLEWIIIAIGLIIVLE